MTNIESNVVKVAISGAAGNIGYALIPLLASGYVFGETPIELRLLEIPPALKALSGIRMELIDSAFPHLTNVICTSDPCEAFDNVDVVVLVGGYPRKQGMERKDLIQANTKIFTSMGRALNEAASPDVKVLVVANPANTNCLVALSEAASIPTKNFAALTYLDHQRAKAQIACKLGLRSAQIKNVTIWGNHSNTQFPDALSDGYYVNDDNGEQVSLSSVLTADDELLDWITNEFVTTVQNRGKRVIEVRGSSSALSAAQATADCLKTWLVTGTRDGETVSMAVYNDQGYYGVRKGLVFSFPVECKDGEWYVKTGLNLSDAALKRLNITEKELMEEREDANSLISKTLPSLRLRGYSSAASTASLASSESDTDFVQLTSRI